MAREPQRAAEPRHLNAHIVPVERALIARATAIEEKAEAEMSVSLKPALHAVAAEFRALAAELHHW